MGIDAKAAVLHGHGQKMSIEPVEIGEPREDEVLIEIAACGVCHTDMVMRDGHLPTPTPVVLGHEGAGKVLAIGSKVDHVSPGDGVLLSFDSCGGCPSCAARQPAYCHEFFPLNFFAQRSDGSTAITQKSEPVHSHVFGQSAFSTHAVARARNVIKAPDDLPLDILAPLGCGIQTGAGAVLNSLNVKAGASVLVMGVGAVGMASVMAAGIATAAKIVVLDLSEERLAIAKKLGATHTIHSAGAPLGELLAEQQISGVDYIVDTTGVAALVEQAVYLLNPRGVLALVAAYTPDEKICPDLSFLMSGGRKIQGVVEGGADPQTFIPKLIEYYRQGKLPLEELIERFPFSKINEAIEAGESGRVIKPVITMN